MDKYKNFEELQKGEKAKHYIIRKQEGTSVFAILAPHGEELSLAPPK